MDLGISWALTGLETAVFRGYSWLVAVTPKPLPIKGFWVIFQSTPNGIRTRAATLKGWTQREERSTVIAGRS